MNRYTLTIRYPSGVGVVTEIDDETLDEALDAINAERRSHGKPEIADLDVDGYIENAVAGHRPHWTWIGDLYVHTQAISGIELTEIHEAGEVTV